MYLSVRHFQHFIEGVHVVVYTDHKPLLSAVSSASTKYLEREIRHLDFLSQFDLEFRHIQGVGNQVADALSRISVNSIEFPDGLDYDTMAAAQASEGLGKRASDCDIVSVPLNESGRTLLCVRADGSFRPLVPASLRRKVFDSLHGLSHPGVRGTVKLVAERFSWKGLQKDVRDWVRGCVRCQCSKVHRHTQSPIGTFDLPDARFSHVHIDLVGPLPPSRGFRYLLTCVDRYTRWCEAVPLVEASAELVVGAFLLNWVARFGAPKIVTTDRGAQFESALFTRLCNFLGCERNRTTAYHPAANGMVERLHRQLKASLMSADNAAHWVDNLSLVLLGIRSTFKPDIGACAAELVYGAPLRLPGELLSPKDTAHLGVSDLLHRLRQFAQTLQPTPPRVVSRPAYIDSDLRTCTHVYLRCDRVRRPLRPPYDGPSLVVSRRDKVFKIRMGEREETVFIDRLKPAVVEKTERSPSSSPTAASTSSKDCPSKPIPSDSLTTGGRSGTPGSSLRSGAARERVTQRGRRVRFPDRFVSYHAF